MDIVGENIENFIVEYSEELSPAIAQIHEAPLPLKFLNEYVVSNTPFAVRPRCDDEPLLKAVTLWKDEEYLKTTMGTAKVTVKVTPPGQANFIVNDVFMLPEERSMDYTEFLDIYEHSAPYGVFYVQKKNNLIEEFSPLVPDVEADVPWVTEAFGYPPVEANIWIGNKPSYFPMHRNKYDSIYYVIVGSQRFEVFPPVAKAWMPYKYFKKFQWYYETEQWKIKDLNHEIKWIPDNRQPETRKKLMLYTKTKSYYVDINAGEALYLPGLWFHDIHPSEFSIAVNYLYKMKPHGKLPLFRLYDKLCTFPIPCKDAAVDTQSEFEEALRLELTEAYHKKHNICALK